MMYIMYDSRAFFYRFMCITYYWQGFVIISILYETVVVSEA